MTTSGVASDEDRLLGDITVGESVEDHGWLKRSDVAHRYGISWMGSPVQPQKDAETDVDRLSILCVGLSWHLSPLTKSSDKNLPDSVSRNTLKEEKLNASA